MKIFNKKKKRILIKIKILKEVSFFRKFIKKNFNENSNLNKNRENYQMNKYQIKKIIYSLKIIIYYKYKNKNWSNKNLKNNKDFYKNIRFSKKVIINRILYKQ